MYELWKALIYPQVRLSVALTMNMILSLSSPFQFHFLWICLFLSPIIVYVAYFAYFSIWLPSLERTVGKCKLNIRAVQNGKFPRTMEHFIHFRVKNR